MEKVLNALIKNTPLALVVIGLFLVLIGAAGGFERLSLKIEEPGWRLGLAAMGALVAGFGALLLIRGKGAVEASALAKECQLKFTSPPGGADVEERVQMAGTFAKRPPEKSVWLLEQSGRNGQYWFQKRPVFEDKNNQWFADARVGGQSGEHRVLHIAVVGSAGQALSDYYFKVGRETGKWTAIEILPPDIILCDSVNVRRK